MIVYADNKVGTELYHRNVFDPKGSADGPYPGYHAQNVCHADLRRYLEYIVEHDYYRMMHPVYPTQKKKVPPPKGSKRYKKAQKCLEKQARRTAIKNVLELIDSVAS